MPMDVLRVDIPRQLGEAILHEHEKPDEGPGGERVREADHHQADQRHADDVLRVDIPRQLGEAILHEHEKPDEGPGGDAA
jgi:hypothetical protein